MARKFVHRIVAVSSLLHLLRLRRQGGVTGKSRSKWEKCVGARVDQEMGRFLSRIWLEAEGQFSGFCGVEKEKKD